MKFLIRPRNTGKTHRAIEWLRADPDRVLIVHTAAEAQRLHKDYDIPTHQLISARQAQSGGLRGSRLEVGVENIDLLFYEWLGVQPDFVTATGELA